MGEKENKSKSLSKFIPGILVGNILLMIVIAFVLIAIALFALNTYTRHNHSSEVPDLRGMQVQDAKAMVTVANLKYEVVDSIYQSGGTPGSILEQIPFAKSKVKEGRTIYLTVQSASEPKVTIPDLENASLRQAETLLRTLGFSNIHIEYIPSEYKDLVYSIEHRGSSLKSGQKIPKSSAITIKVGDGNSSPLEVDSLTADDLDIETDF